MDFIHDLISDFPNILAQKIEDPQVIEKLQANFKNFIETGQAWALGIGFFLGYLFSKLTNF